MNGGALARKKRRNRIGDIKTMNRLFPAADVAARSAGVPVACAEHLIIAAFDLPDGSARRAFTRVGVDPDDFTRIINEMHASSDEGDRGGVGPMVKGKGPLKTEESAQRVFKQVVDMVRSERTQLYGAYLILVSAQLGEPTPCGAFEAMGVTPGQMAAAARAELDEMINA